MLRNRIKNCYHCKKESIMLYRCRYEEKYIERNRVYGKWVFICKICLVIIKEKFSSTYQYGGTWKSKKK